MRITRLQISLVVTMCHVSLRALMFSAGVIFVCLARANDSIAQSEDLKEQFLWQSQYQVKAVLGEPNSVRLPVGTHAEYTLWEYDQVIVAFANERVIHVFDKNALRKSVELDSE